MLELVAQVALGYVALVVVFETFLGVVQPTPDRTVSIATGPPGRERRRVVARLESAGSLYVAANHWPRAWYRRALAEGRVRIVDGEDRGSYSVAPVTGEERARVAAEHPLGLGLRFLMGFAPRRFLRLDPLERGSGGPEPGSRGGGSAG